MTENVVLDV